MDGVAASMIPSSPIRPGKMLVGPAFDSLRIGGLLSRVAGGILYWGGYNFPNDDPYLWWAILVSNWAHFTASTVPLYTKPYAVKTWPFLTLAFPVSVDAIKPILSHRLATAAQAGGAFVSVTGAWWRGLIYLSALRDCK
jgi:hypothetical protein